MQAEKRFQIFVSSTFRDLMDERQAVLKAVLELNHMPAGMELFPASDESAWELIKGVIDASDYYVLIIGGRYGSLDDAGIGYTEKEYDYAASLKKPVIPFLHKSPNNIPRAKTETDTTAWEKLEGFRRKIEDAHTCVYWDSVDSLKASVILGLTSAVKKHPAIGWIRADQIPSDATVSDILRLRNQVAELEANLEGTKSEPPPGTEDLYQGDDYFKIRADHIAAKGTDISRYYSTIFPTWNEIFGGVAPDMISEIDDSHLRSALRQSLSKIALTSLEEVEELAGHRFTDFRYEKHDLDTIVVQLRALGLIQESVKNRSIRDTATYWALTPFGDRLMVQLRALRKTPPVHRKEAGTTERAPMEENTNDLKKKQKKIS